MRTEHLISLLADVQVEKSTTNTAMQYLDGLKYEHMLEIAGMDAQLSALLVQLNNSIEVAGHSFLLNHYAASNLVKALNKKGFSFTLPKCEGILHLKMQIANITFPGNKEFAAEFVLKMLQSELSSQDLAAVQACLDLIENQIEV